LADSKAHGEFALPTTGAGFKRRGLLKFGTLATAVTGAAAITTLSANTAHASLQNTLAPTELSFSSATNATGLLATPRVRQPQNASVITTFQPSHGWVGANTPLNIADDISDFVLGLQSIKVVTTTTRDPASLQKTGLNLDATGKTFRVCFKIDGLTKLSELLLYAGDNSLANNYSWVLIDGNAVSAQQFSKEGEWISMTVNWGDCTVAGAPNRSSIQNVRLRARSLAGQSVIVHYNSVTLVDEGPAYPNGVVSITFDDSSASQATEGQPYLDRYGFGATYYTICDLIGTNRYMTMAQLRKISDYSPSEIAAHAFSRLNHDTTFPKLAPNSLDIELRNLRLWLQYNGFEGGDHLAYPQGAFTPEVLSMVGKYFASGRTILSKIETLRPANPLRLRSLSLTNTTSVAYVNSAIDRAYSNRGWLILTFHDIVPNPTNGTEYSTSNYRSIIDYLSLKGIPVRTVGEVLKTL